MKLLMTLVLLLSSAVDSFSQVCYYPLAVGNVWDYGAPYQQWVAIGDTLLPDGKVYSVLQETRYYQKKYLRQEGDSVFWGSSLYYDFTRMPGDTLWKTSNSFKYLSARGDTTIFGSNLQWWEFTRIVFVGQTAGGDVEKVIDSVGMVYYWESFDFYFQPWVLRGAIIDGRQLGTVSALEESRSQEIATECALMQNYPNPFNPSTTIKYELPKPAVVRLSVYDMLGRQVSVVVNERRDAGVHEVKFSAKGGSASGGDGSNLASGVYIYRLQAGDFVQSKKLVILK